jgi:flagellar biosynthesis/type III secretory pathway protein FliH
MIDEEDETGRREELAEKMVAMLFKIDEVTAREQECRHISAGDAAHILECTDYLYSELYGEYPEFKERYMEFEERIKSRWHFDKEQEFLEKGRAEGFARGLEEGRVEGVARGVDMVLDLLKKGYSEAQIREAVLKADGMPNSSTQQS